MSRRVVGDLNLNIPGSVYHGAVFDVELTGSNPIFDFFTSVLIRCITGVNFPGQEKEENDGNDGIHQFTQARLNQG